MFGDDEYVRQRSRLLQEKERLKEKIKTGKGRGDKWLEFGERAFNFACYAKYWFENEGLEEKNTILRTIGSNFTLKDKKLYIDLKNPWLFIMEGKERAEEEKTRLELLETPTSPGTEPSLAAAGPVWPPGTGLELDLP